MCKLCAKHSKTVKTSIESYAEKIEQLEEEVEEIKNIVKDLNIKLDKIKFCPFCNAPAPKSAKYCGICGKLI